MDERVRYLYISFFRDNFIAKDNCLEFFVEPKVFLEDLLGGKSWFDNMIVRESGLQG